MYKKKKKKGKNTSIIKATPIEFLLILVKLFSKHLLNTFFTFIMVLTAGQVMNYSNFSSTTPEVTCI